MNQSFPSNWPDLPDYITYEKKLSERFTTESEPEYIIGNTEGVQFLIRVYEGGKKEILTYNLVNHSTMYIPPEKPFYPVLENLYDLMGCEYIHTPPDHEVHYRGYNADTQMIWEYTDDCEFKKQSPSKFPATAFLKSDVTHEDIEDKGKLLATVDFQKENGTASLESTGVSMVDLEIKREFYENVVLLKKDGEIKDSYPIPENVLIINTLNELMDNSYTGITQINEPIKSKVISKNI